MKINTTKGKIILAGAGPGDPELLTLKALKYLRIADVVLADRLVSKEILSDYVSTDAEIILVGKQCGRTASVSQQTINKLMIEHALNEKLVVRLKGGDVSVFSNILDELETIIQYDIPYEIIPGITAASGAAAYSGIPLTARGYASAVRFLTYYKHSRTTTGYWKELAKTSDTLVFYMSSETLPELVNHLISQQIDEDKGMAIIEQAATPFQHVHICNIYDFQKRFNEQSFISPSLIIIGKVVSLHERFTWFKNYNGRQNYFEPLGNKKILLNQTEKTYEYVS